MKKISMVSLGCSKNLIDAEQMLSLLEKDGYEIVESEEDADIMIVNTCAFIESAKREAIDCILEHASYKESGDRLLIVTGCLGQRYKDEVLREIPEVDIVVGTNEYDKIVDIIKEHVGNKQEIYCSDKPMECETLERTLTTPPYSAFLKIAEGCDNCCTYCVIPSIRGRYRSRTIESIVEEAKKLVLSGAKELIVIAQDTTRYGKDIYGEYKLPQLLRELCRIDGLSWVRLHYCYPELVTDELIDVMASEEKICNYIDIPIQHSCDRILKLMGRRTNNKELTALIARLRERIPDIVIRTTLIVGFPSETDEEFSALRDFVNMAEFDRLGVFAYSQEEGTAAARLSGQIEEGVKLDRQEIIMIDQAAISEELSSKRVGKVYTVLTEGYDAVIKQYYGRSYADSAEVDGKVFFTSKKKIADGDMVSVKITDYSEFDLYGEAVNG